MVVRRVFWLLLHNINVTCSPHERTDMREYASEPPGYRKRSSGLPLSARHRLLHHRDELLERERLGQEVELLAVGQALFEGILRVAGHEDDLDVRIALAQLLH